jgi:signal transduction histidine kinase
MISRRQTEQDSTNHHEKLNILMVDDQPAKLLSYEAILGDLNENLIKAGSAREALEVLLKTDVAVVLMDVSMPELDGFELAEIIRQHPRYQKTAIIFVSGVHLSDMDQLKGYERGAVDYVSVPIIPQILKAKVGIFVDLYRKTRQLEEMNQHLERRVADRTEELEKRAAELESLNEELTRSNRELDAFTYIASHDLKEPLRGIHNYAHFLQEDYEDKLDEAGHERLRTLQRLTQRMEGLIEALLRYSRLGRQDLERRDTNLQELLDEAIELLTTRIHENGVTIRQPRPLPYMQVDRTLVGELIVNLITNAIKYNDKADRWVEIGWTENSADGSSLSPIVFYVRDNGIGISRSHHENVFRIFKRLHARDEWGGGSGVGLTIVRRIIERHGGKIWLESEVDAGTTFYFTLDGGKEKDDWNRYRSADVVAD